MYALWLKHSAQKIACTVTQLKGVRHTVAHGHMFGSRKSQLRIWIYTMHLSCTLLQSEQQLLGNSHTVTASQQQPCKGICNNLSALSGRSRLIVYPSRS